MKRHYMEASSIPEMPLHLGNFLFSNRKFITKLQIFEQHKSKFSVNSLISLYFQWSNGIPANHLQ